MSCSGHHFGQFDCGTFDLLIPAISPGLWRLRFPYDYSGSSIPVRAFSLDANFSPKLIPTDSPMNYYIFSFRAFLKCEFLGGRSFLTTLSKNKPGLFSILLLWSIFCHCTHLFLTFILYIYVFISPLEHALHKKREFLLLLSSVYST